MSDGLTSMLGVLNLDCTWYAHSTDSELGVMESALIDVVGNFGNGLSGGETVSSDDVDPAVPIMPVINPGVGSLLGLKTAAK